MRRLITAINRTTHRVTRARASFLHTHARALARNSMASPTAMRATSASPSIASSPSACNASLRPPPPDLSHLPNPYASVAAVPVVPLQFSEPRRPVNFEDGWEYFRRIGSPRHVCAPMVNQSELAFRLLCRRYNTHLAVTPMFHAGIFGSNPQYRREAMQVPQEAQRDRPVVAQYCANDPALLLKAAKFVEDVVDAVDINCGCPQGIAKRGHYGAFLLTEYQLLHDMVSTLHQHLRIPVTVKIRGLPASSTPGDIDVRATIALVRMLQEAGAAMITIHGRTRFQLKDKVGACSFDLIRLVKANCSVPVFANGGIETMEDVDRCIAETGVDGVMSSEALLCNPSIFTGERRSGIDIAREYMQIVHDLEKEGTETEQSMVRAHLFKMLYQHVSLHTDLRDRLAHCDPAEFDDIVSCVAARFEGLSPEEVAAQLAAVPVWYQRHKPTATQLAAAAEKARIIAAEREAAALANAADDVDEGLCGGFSIFDEEPECADGCSSDQQQQAAQ